MAWTVITDATLEVGKALRALTMRNLRDNIAAMAAGNAGAPQIQTAAIATGAVTNAKLSDNTIATSRLLYSTAGDGYVMAYLGQTSTTRQGSAYTDWSDVAVSPIRAHIIGYGVVRVRFQQQSVNTSASFARIVLEGTVIAEWSQSVGTNERVADMNVSPGQRLVIQQRGELSNTNTTIINPRILSGTVALTAVAHSV